MPPPTLICFDWGGVILRICRTWSEACAAAGLPVRPGSESGESHPGRRDIVRAHQEGRLEFDDYTRRLSAAFDHLYTPDEIARIHDAWLLHEYPGVADLIADLHARPHLRTALLSNTNQRHLLRGLSTAHGGHAHFPTAHTLHHCLYSNRLGHTKPRPEFYNALPQAAGVAPSAILFFDDLEENIAAAHSLGWNATLIDHAGDTAAQMRRSLHEHAVLQPVDRLTPRNPDRRTSPP